MLSAWMMFFVHTNFHRILSDGKVIEMALCQMHKGCLFIETAFFARLPERGPQVNHAGTKPSMPLPFIGSVSNVGV